MSFKLQWQPSDKAEEQEVYRDTQPIPNEPAYAPLAALSSSDTEYTDTTPEAFTRYYYRVAAVRRQFGLERSLSNQVAIGYESGPSLELGFTDQEYAILDGAGVLQPSTFGALLNFSRASVATYIDANGILQTAAANQPRFAYDPMTGLPLGLLIEGAATKLLLWSEDFSKSEWTKQRASIGAVADISGFKVTEITATETTVNGFTVRQVVTHASASLISVKAIFKKGSGDFTCIVLFGPSTNSGCRHWFNLATGTVGSSNVFGTGWTKNSASIKALGNGLFEIDFSVNRPSGTQSDAVFYVSSPSDLSLACTVGDVGYVGPCQLEIGRPSSYIKTEGAQATRAADVCSRTLGAEYNPNEGTLYWEFVKSADYSASQALGLYQSQNNFISIFSDGSNSPAFNAIGCLIHVAGNQSASIITSVIPVMGQKYKVALSYATGEAAMAVNGVYYQTAITQGVPIATTLSGRVGGLTTPMFPQETHRDIAYFPRALTESELIALTTL